MIGWKCGFIWPCDRNSGNQSCACGPAASRPASAGPARRPRRTANRHARSEIDSEQMTLLEPLVPPRPGEHEPFHGDVARGGLGGEVLDLVEHGRPVREQSHAIHGGGGGGHTPSDRPQRPGSLSDHVVDRALVGDLDRPAERALRLAARPVASSSSEKWVSTSRLRPRPRAVLARLGRGQVPAVAVALGARQRRLDQQQVGVAGELAQLVVGRAVGAEREPRAALGELDRVARDEVRDGREADGERRRSPACRPGRTRSARTRSRCARRSSRRTRERRRTPRARPAARSAAAGPARPCPASRRPARAAGAARSAARRRTARGRGCGRRAGG